MVTEKAVLVGPFVGEMFWEFFRFVPRVVHARFKQYRDPSIKFIVFTRPERFDMYGTIADTFIPLRIEGDGTKYISECYRLMNLPIEYHQELVKSFYEQYSKRYIIIDSIVPDVINKKNYLNKKYYPPNLMRYEYLPRDRNKVLVDDYLRNCKPTVVIAPRLRRGMKRNWGNWQRLYNMIADSELHKTFDFVICGKHPDYVEDISDGLKYMFYDLNDIPVDDGSSLIGLTIETIKRSVLTIGSQSAIPNISLLLGTEVLEWGDQRSYHTVTYNIFKTKVTFLDDPTFSIQPEVVFEKLNEILQLRKGELEKCRMNG